MVFQALSKYVSMIIYIAYLIIYALFFCLSRYGMPKSVTKAMDIANTTCTMYFLCEMIIRIIGLGPHVYISYGYNLYDGSITIIGVIDVALLWGNVSLRSPGMLTVFRCLRLLLVLRLARFWKSLKKTIDVLINSLMSVVWLTVLLFLFLFVTGLVGMTVSGDR